MKAKFVIGIGVILAAIVAVMVLTIMGNSSTEVKVNDLVARKQSDPEVANRSFKVTGIVVGDSIVYDASTLNLEFDMVNAREVLHDQTALASAPRVRVQYRGVRPDTLVHEATAIATGRIGADGKFRVDDSPDALLLKCPTKYEQQAKDQASR
jgi:cytochrome c-type biogenesis protein CcmE